MQLLLINCQTMSDINSYHLTSTIFHQHLARCHGNHAIYDYWGYYVTHEHFVYRNSFDGRYIKAIFHHCHHWLVCDVRLQYCDCDSIRCYGNQGKVYHVQICGNINFRHFFI